MTLEIKQYNKPVKDCKAGEAPISERSFASVEHLVDAINTRDFTPKNADLSGIDFTGYILEMAEPGVDEWGDEYYDIDFSGSDLSGCDLSNQRESHYWKLNDARLHKTNFTGNGFGAQSFVGADAEGSIFDNCTFEEVNFYEANLRNSSFKDVYAFKTPFDGADMSGSRFLINEKSGRNNMAHVNLSGAMLSKHVLDYTFMPHVIIDDKTLIETKSGEFGSAEESARLKLKIEEESATYDEKRQTYASPERAARLEAAMEFAREIGMDAREFKAVTGADLKKSGPGS